MKLIAKKDFFNSKLLGVKLSEKTEGFKHPDIIHKGCRFAIGAQEFYKDLNSIDQESVGTLLRQGLVAFDTKENLENGVIAAIEAEVKAEAAALAAVPAAPATVEDILKALPGMIAAAVAAQAPAKK